MTKVNQLSEFFAVISVFSFKKTKTVYFNLHKKLIFNFLCGNFYQTEFYIFFNKKQKKREFVPFNNTNS